MLIDKSIRGCLVWSDNGPYLVINIQLVTGDSETETGEFLSQCN